MKEEVKNFSEGARVITPDGEGEVVRNDGSMVTVKLNSGEVKKYPAERVSDDSDAG